MVKPHLDPADEVVVTERLDDRCPRCSALVRADSPWCTLCYADLRPQLPAYAASVAEAPSAAPASAQSAAISAAPSPWAPDAPAFDPLTAPFSVLEAATMAPPPAPVLPEAAPDPTVAPTAPTAASAPSTDGKLVGLPCPRCQTLVPLDDLSCPTCGSSLLDEVQGEPDLFSRFATAGVSTTTQWMIIGVGSLAFVVVAIGVLYLASLFL
jgi:RNA polymerase subunit RPABC4/transcription elongation factor Spt4